MSNRRSTRSYAQVVSPRGSPTPTSAGNTAAAGSTPTNAAANGMDPEQKKALTKRLQQASKKQKAELAAEQRRDELKTPAGPRGAKSKALVKKLWLGEEGSRGASKRSAPVTDTDAPNDDSSVAKKTAKRKNKRAKVAHSESTRGEATSIAQERSPAQAHHIIPVTNKVDTVVHDRAAEEDPEAGIDAAFHEDRVSVESDADSGGSEKSVTSEVEYEVDEDFGIPSDSEVDDAIPLSSRQAANITAKMALGVPRILGQTAPPPVQSAVRAHRQASKLKKLRNMVALSESEEDIAMNDAQILTPVRPPLSCVVSGRSCLCSLLVSSLHVYPTMPPPLKPPTKPKPKPQKISSSKQITPTVPPCTAVGGEEPSTARPPQAIPRAASSRRRTKAPNTTDHPSAAQAPTPATSSIANPMRTRTTITTTITPAAPSTTTAPATTTTGSLSSSSAPTANIVPSANTSNTTPLTTPAVRPSLPSATSTAASTGPSTNTASAGSGPAVGSTATTPSTTAAPAAAPGPLATAVPAASVPITTSPNYWVIVTRPNNPKKMAGLSSQSVEVRKVAHSAVYEVLPDVLFLEMPFPESNEIEAIAAMCVIRAAEKLQYREIVDKMKNDDGYAKIFSDHPRQRISNTRNDAITLMRSVTPRIIDLEGVGNPQHVALAVQALLLEDAFIFPGELDWTLFRYRGDLTQPYCSRLVVAGVKALFSGPNAVLRLTPERLSSSDPKYPDEREFPLVTVAFAATCAGATFVDWQLGVQNPVKFWASQFRDRFKNHVATLEDMRVENPEGYHIIMAFIYQAATGVQPAGSVARGQHPLTQGGQANPNVAVMQAGTTLQLASRAV